MARAWITLPADAGWGPTQAVKGQAKRLGYVIDEIRGVSVMLRVSAVRVDSAEALRLPGQR